jgi:hypothetical protein
VASSSRKTHSISSNTVASAVEDNQDFQATGNTHDDTRVQLEDTQIADESRNTPRARTVELDRGSTSRGSQQNESTSHHAANHHILYSTDPDEELNSPTSDHDDQSVSSSYFEQLRNILETREPVGPGVGLFGRHSLQASRGSSEFGEASEMDYILPMRSTADNLLSIYWSEIHPFFPYVHKPSFQKQYDDLWERDASPGARRFHCMLNTIFALSCQLNRNLRPKARRAASSSYFYRAKRLLHFDLFEPGTLEDVQALLLMGQYLQNTTAPAKGWAVVGSAIHSLQGLRLHQDGTKTPASTQRDREMFRRIWHGCHMMDR